MKRPSLEECQEKGCQALISQSGQLERVLEALTASEAKLQQEISSKEYFMNQMRGREKRIKELESATKRIHLDKCEWKKLYDKSKEQLVEKDKRIVNLNDMIALRNTVLAEKNQEIKEMAKIAHETVHDFCKELGEKEKEIERLKKERDKVTKGLIEDNQKLALENESLKKENRIPFEKRSSNPKTLWDNFEEEIKIKSWLGICASNDCEYQVIEEKIAIDICKEAVQQALEELRKEIIEDSKWTYTGKKVPKGFVEDVLKAISALQERMK